MNYWNTLHVVIKFITPTLFKCFTYKLYLLNINTAVVSKFGFNTYLTDSYIVFTLKMESVSKNTIFGLKMIVKSGLEKIFLKFLHAEVIFF